jgi:2-polyprenyl-6-methoxyphenol hydroxylase-like FAD-dependent oxidoreductase
VSGRVLISGVGIAGPALAFWLHRYGFEPTLVEQAPAPRTGGQAVDVRGVAIDVLRQMDLYGRADALRTHMQGGSVMDSEGREIWRSEERSFSAGRLDSGDIELFRDDLVKLLCDATQGVAEYLWGNSIARVVQSQAGVHVELDRGSARDFDLLIAADGLHSNVRRLVFGEEAPFVRSLGVGLAIFTTPNLLNPHDWQISHRDEASGYLIYPNRDNTQLRVNLGFGLETEAWRSAVLAQKELVAQRCAHLRWEIPRLIEAMWNAPEFYFGDVAQVKMDAWSRGRVALLGDAAFCPSPFSGQGTSLALVGAFVLARELSGTPRDAAGAFLRYESRMRPFVELNQALADPNRAGPIPDDTMDRAKRGIVLADLVDGLGPMCEI